MDPDEPPPDSGIIVEDEVDFRPTLIGDSSVVMIDISRLPRLDQYNPFIASDESRVQSPSDVKSLAYFFSSAEGGMDEKIELAQGRAPGGLYRREVDRAVATHMGDTEMVSGPDDYTKLIASEIAQLSFRYFDGDQWQDQWIQTKTMVSRQRLKSRSLSIPNVVWQRLSPAPRVQARTLRKRLSKWLICRSPTDQAVQKNNLEE